MASRLTQSKRTPKVTFAGKYKVPQQEVWDSLGGAEQWIVQELLLPDLSALCVLSGKLVSAIQSGEPPDTRKTVTVIMDSIALLCNAH